MVTVIQQDQNISPTEEEQKAHNNAQSKSLKRKTPNFSRQLPLRKDYDMDSPMTEAPTLPSMTSLRAEEFHMVGIERDAVPTNDDSFGILSPIATEFPKNPFEKVEPTSEEQPGFSFFPVVGRKTPEPKPFSVGSPTSTEFPQDFPLRDDLLQPTLHPSSSLRRTTPKPSLRTKFSSPNLQEARRLQQMQNEIEAALPSSTSPKRHFDDLDALMSPRATEFTVNPFHDLLSVKPANLQAEKSTPVTPTKSDVDPRSPAQHGISPITRNIFDVL
jgi:tyrosine-protein phosphatase